jgi:signal transduction histidine kinase
MFAWKNLLQLRSFRLRIFWSLVPIFCVLFVFVGLVDLYKQKQLAEDEINERAKSMAENLAYASRLAVLTEDKWLLEAALHGVTGAADFAYILIYGEKWTPLVQAAGKNVDFEIVNAQLEAHQKEHLLSSREELLSRNIVAGRSRYVEYIAPIAASAQSKVPYELQIESRVPSPTGGDKETRKTIGAVRLGLSLNRLDSQMVSFLKWRSWSVAVFLCLSTVAIYIFSDRITRPINRLTEQAKKMSKGLLDQSIPVESRDEIGQLAMTFNDMARALKELYSGLESKVAERTDELRNVNIKLAEASEHKSRFLANVNHELRTPLSSIIGYARLLQRGTEGRITSLQRENLEDLLRNAERLLGLIDGLLDFAKIEAGKMEIHIEPVKYHELIQSAAATIEPMLNAHTVRLVRDVPLTIVPLLYTDREKLRQIILNLLGNAVKFTDHGEIRISACLENGHFKLAVADTGIGIEKADMDRIFEEFDRGRLQNDGDYRGTGLGLAIVKRLVDALGGSVAVESEVAKGSTFTVSLPLKYREADSV